MTAGLRAREALRIEGGRSQSREEWVIEETPVALLYNGLSFAVMMATPCDLEDFALGFALCEGIVAHPGEFALVDRVRDEHGIALHAAIPQARYDALLARQRGLEGRSGCGLCGVSSLREAVRPARRRTTALPVLEPDRIHAGLRLLSRQQPLNARSGGVHAAGFVYRTDRAVSSDALNNDAANGDEVPAADDASILVREDVGRHNALDKLVGAMHRRDPALDPADGFLVITSRASYEIVHKAANAGIALVAAVSAPTDLAIRHAEAAGIALIAFAREGRMNVYTDGSRVATE